MPAQLPASLAERVEFPRWEPPEASVTCEHEVVPDANHYQSERFHERDVTHRYVPCTFGRRARLAELVAAGHGAHTPESVMRMLADHGTPEGRLCLHDPPHAPGTLPRATKATVVMAPTWRTLWV